MSIPTATTRYVDGLACLAAQIDRHVSSAEQAGAVALFSLLTEGFPWDDVPAELRPAVIAFIVGIADSGESDGPKAAVQTSYFLVGALVSHRVLTGVRP